MVETQAQALARLRAAAPHERREAALFLGRHPTSEAMDALLAALGDTDPLAHEAIIHALVQQGLPDKVARLAALLRDDHPGRRNAALSALVEIGARSPETLLSGLSHGSLEIRVRLTEILGDLRDRAAALPLSARLADVNESPTVRHAAAQALGKIGDRAAVPALIQAAEQGDFWVRQAAVEALGRIVDESALPRLLQLLEQDVWMRPAVVQTLGNIGRPEAVPALVRALADVNETTRVGALEALVKIVIEPRAEAAELAPAAERHDLPAAPLLRELKTGAPPGNAYAAHLLGWLGQPEFLPDLVAALGANDANLRHAASEALLRFGPAAVPGLLTALQDASTQTRESAAELLGFLADASVVPDLAAHLRDPDVNVRLALVRALGAVGGDRAWEALLQSLEDPEVADTALGVLGQQRDARLVGNLQRYLYEGKPSTRWAAARALSLFGDETAVSILLNAIRLPDDAIRRPAAEALARVRGGRAVGVLIEALGDRDPLVRQQAVEALGRIPDSRAVAALLPLAEDAEWRVRRALVKALIHIGDARIFPPLEILARDPDRWVRRAVLEGCASLDDGRATEILIKGLNDAEIEVVRAGLVSLGRRRDPAAARPVAERLTDSNPDIRAIAVRALTHLGGPMAAERLPLLVHDPVENVRLQVADTLGEMGSEALIEALEVLLRDEAQAVRERAAEGLAHIGTLRAAEALAGALSADLCRPAAQAQLARLGDMAVRALLTSARSSEAALRAAAAETLGQLKSAQAAPTLRILLKDPDARVRLAAEAALKVIERKP